ncbi:Osmolarity sensor protein EnvZ [Pannonibacter phragmitetus]|uniref:histidine kinase n=1 Tax=Pannonibacter phragmitetus TaxID=121719 RepID=A0A378ZSN6_9HYPH|nr:ATP-binding protein [Pannonibacter phragmitetus]SUB00157.1 Osmolarity sensor protein EnvZ [Pannonibacter phragmitetus]
MTAPAFFRKSATFLRRLWPRSLGGQLIALLLIALIGSQAVSIWLFAGERRLAVYEAIGDGVIVRTASLVPLLDTAGGTTRSQLLQATSSAMTRFWVDSEPLVASTPQSGAERRLAGALAEELGQDPGIRASLSAAGTGPDRRNEKPAREEWKKREETRETSLQKLEERERRREERLRHRLIAIEFSVPLADGQWLNVLTSHRPPPPGAFYTLVLQMGLMALAIIAIVAFTIRQVSRPLRQLADAADRLGRGEDVPPVPEAGPRELRSTISAFNAMQDRLSRFVADRTRMLAAISHDLRTPITSLRLRAEFIDDDENREKIIATLDEMAAMTEATLAFARDEAVSEQREAVDLMAVLESLAGDQTDMGHDVRLMAADRDPMAPAIALPCRPLAFKRALRNLIENAIRYGGSARIFVEGGQREVIIRVEDDGPGIPEDRMGDVFEPFVRLETSRSGETGGIGLGLAIARSLIHAHGGTITLTNRPEGGLTATVTLPL